MNTRTRVSSNFNGYSHSSQSTFDPFANDNIPPNRFNGGNMQNYSTTAHQSSSSSSSFGGSGGGVGGGGSGPGKKGKKTIPNGNIPKKVMDNMIFKACEMIDMMPENQRPFIVPDKMIELDQPGKATWYLKMAFNVFTDLQKHGDPKNQIKKPDIVYKAGNGGWNCKVTIYHPCTTVFESFTGNKKNSEQQSCLKAVIFLRQRNVLSEKLTPISPNEEETKRLYEKLNEPAPIMKIPMDMRDKMEDFISKFQEDVVPYINGLQDEEESQMKQRLKSSGNAFGSLGDLRGAGAHIPTATNGGPTHTPYVGRASNTMRFDDARVNQTDCMFDIVTGTPYYKPSPRSDELRNQYLSRLFQPNQQYPPSLTEYREKMFRLPVYSVKNEFVNLIQNNRVVVISGETGCGKTTQIPQILMEEFVRNNRGAECSIVVTQPRRLPAIAISDQVAYQMGEENSGRTVGYHVRGEKRCPQSSRGGILFCTTGILTRKMSSNPDLIGVSHVIVDEVHERDIICDLLLMLLKRLLDRNPDVKLILMSASINANLFSRYFFNAPIFNIHGRVYPVKDFFLPQVLDQMSKSHNISGYSQEGKSHQGSFRKVNRDLITDLIVHIDSTRPEGAILCFLPGWEDIKSIGERLTNAYRNMTVVQLHSMIPHQEQKAVFATPIKGMRKVVLATNIAETSLTVPDVVYVIDPGLCKEMRYDNSHNVSSFGLHWISQANAIQRMGRAGRVSMGECFKLYEESTLLGHFNSSPIPEMLRTPLEYTVLQCKLYCPNESIREFLSTAIDPPTFNALQSALNSLDVSNILEGSTESLTPLGRKIVHFTLHPKMSVSLIAGAFFGCLDPVLSILATLSAPREPFYLAPGEDRAIIRSLKSKITGRIRSDHIAYANVVKEYENSRGMRTGFDNRLNMNIIKPIMENKKIFGTHLIDVGLIKSTSDWTDYMALPNRKIESHRLILAALLIGMYPNLAVVREGKITGNKLRRGYTTIDVNTGQPVRFVSESVFKDMSEASLSSGFLTYANSFYSEETRQLTIKEASLISPLTFFIFVGRRLVELGTRSYRPNGSDAVNEVIVMFDDSEHLRFALSRDDYNLLCQWKNAFYQLTSWYISEVRDKASSFDMNVAHCARTFFNHTDKLLALEEEKGF